MIQSSDHHFARRFQQNLSSKGSTSDFIQAGLALEANRQRTYCKSAMVRALVQGPRHPRVRAPLRYFSGGVHQHHDADPCLDPVRRNSARRRESLHAGRSMRATRRSRDCCHLARINLTSIRQRLSDANRSVNRLNQTKEMG